MYMAALATYSLLPILQKFSSLSSTLVVPSDISLAGRILAAFPSSLTPSQHVPDNLARLGELALTPSANIVKLPNISASIPQLNECIAELRGKGFDVPLYPQEPTTPEEKEANGAYAKVLGSAVNPVLREGNSDRRAAGPVKKYAMRNPHKMGEWPGRGESRSHVSHMSGGDFFESEKSVVVGGGTVEIKLRMEDGTERTMKEVEVIEGTHLDGSFMSVKALRAFYEEQMGEAKVRARPPLTTANNNEQQQSNQQFTKQISNSKTKFKFKN